MVLHKGQNPIEKILLANCQKSSMVKFTISHEIGHRLNNEKTQRLTLQQKDTCMDEWTEAWIWIDAIDGQKDMYFETVY